MSSWVPFFFLLLCFSFNGVSNARHRKHTHSPAILTGTVQCHTCVRPKSTHFISGATVAVECGGDGVKQRFREEVKTNEKGEFEAKLPVSVGKNLGKIKRCSVRLISSNQPYCAVATDTTAQDIRFKSKKGGTRVFSAGLFSFKPQSCDRKSPKSDKLSDRKQLGLPIPLPLLPPVPGLAPIPGLPPVPGLPPLPVLPPIPLPPASTSHVGKTTP